MLKSQELGELLECSHKADSHVLYIIHVTSPSEYGNNQSHSRTEGGPAA